MTLDTIQEEFAIGALTAVLNKFSLADFPTASIDSWRDGVYAHLENMPDPDFKIFRISVTEEQSFVKPFSSEISIYPHYAKN